MSSEWWESQEEVTATLRLLLEGEWMECLKDEVLYYLQKPWKWTEERARALAGEKADDEDDEDLFQEVPSGM